MSKEKELRKRELLASLVSSDDKIAVKAIKSLRNEGDETLLRQAVALINPEQDNEVQQSLRALLFDLKDPAMTAVMVDLAGKAKSDMIQQILLSAIWNSRLDASDHLLKLLEIATKGSYMVQVECMTIIENFDVAPANDEVEQGVGLIGEYLAMRNPDDYPILLTIQKILLEDLLGSED